MSVNNGTSLYLQVEEALHEFKTGVTRLRDQQAQTDALLARGNEALDNLVHQVSRVDKMQEDVEADLRLLERFRENMDSEFSRLHTAIRTDMTQQEQQTRQALDNIKTDLSVRRQELLGLIRDLRQGLVNLEKDNRETLTGLSGQIQVQKSSGDKLAADLDTRFKGIAAWHSDLTARIISLESKQKYLVWAMAGLGTLAAAALIHALR